MKNQLDRDMSLGWNSQRKPQQTNLPGAVGNSVMVQSRSTRPAPRRRPQSAIPSSSTSLGSSSLRIPPKPHTPKTQLISPLQSTHNEEEDVHWVYGTTLEALTDTDGKTVAAKDERILLVYPMRSDSVTGIVSMRRKTAHPNTGQLKYEWVPVYVPDEDRNLVSNFSVVP